MSYQSAFAALADPTRRAIFERLRRRERAVGEIARASRVTQPAVSQHLRVLERARLVRSRREGTRRYYRADNHGLAELRRYIESMWDDVLQAYADETRTAKEES